MHDYARNEQKNYLKHAGTRTDFRTKSLSSTMKLKAVLKLNHIQNCRPKQSKMIAKLRMGALMINNETGRYGDKSSNVHHKGCDVCNNKDATEYLSILPFYEEALVEDERHILITCPRYDKIRSSLPNNIKSLLLSEVSLLFEDTNIKIFSNYVRRILDTRFPKVQKCKNKGD